MNLAGFGYVRFHRHRAQLFCPAPWARSTPVRVILYYLAQNRLFAPRLRLGASRQQDSSSRRHWSPSSPFACPAACSSQKFCFPIASAISRNSLPTVSSAPISWSASPCLVLSHPPQNRSRPGRRRQRRRAPDPRCGPPRWPYSKSPPLPWRYLPTYLFAIGSPHRHCRFAFIRARHQINAARPTRGAARQLPFPFPLLTEDSSAMLRSVTETSSHEQTIRSGAKARWTCSAARKSSRSSLSTASPSACA